MKSTTTGHLLFKLGIMDDRKRAELTKKAEELGKSSFMFAHFMDNQKAEQERGITISCTTKEFFTDNYHYTVIDAPGHRDFLKNMISGASQADVALLMVPADKGGFERAIAKGNHKTGEVMGQTRQHAQLCYLLGIEQLVVGINKMDAESVNYSEERYNEIKDEVHNMLRKQGWAKKMDSIPFIPLSGWTGENLTEESTNMPWYKGFEVKVGNETVKGNTLVDALTNVARPPKRPTDAPLRVPVSQLIKIPGIGDIVTGRIEQGTLKPGMNVRFMPSGITGNVFSIEMHHKNVDSAGPGDNVGVNVKKLPKATGKKKKLNLGGQVMMPENDPSPRGKIKSFTGTMMVQNHPGELRAGAEDKGGFTPVVFVRTGRAPCRMVKIHQRVERIKGKPVKIEDPLFVKAHDQAVITFEPKMPLYLEDFKTCPGLGRVAIMDSNNLVMLGMISNIEYYPEKTK